MKTRFLWALIPTLVLGGVLVVVLRTDPGSGAKPTAGVGGEATSRSDQGVARPSSTAAALPSSPTNEWVEDKPLKAPPAPPKLSAAVEAVVHLAQSAVGDEVVLAYVERSTNRFDLRVSEIVYLHDLGLSPEVIAAMVRHEQAAQDEESTTTSSTREVEAAVRAAAEMPSAVQPASLTTSSAAQAVQAPSSTPGEVVPPPPTEAAPPVTVSAPQTVVSTSYFYETLAPYGTWMDVPNYGWCWRPSVAVANPGWRPYCDNGRWMWTDCGWYWASYYQWGWAPFHYGNWYMSPACGWVWAPGTCWGPAWVTWRQCNGYYGWAPLPPGCGYSAGVGLTFCGSGVSVGFGFGLGAACYTFVPTQCFYSRNPWCYAVPPGQVHSVYKDSTVVNNYINGNNNNVVINVGPGTGAIAQANRREIRKVPLRDADAAAAASIVPARPHEPGAQMAVYRPRLPAQASRPPSEVLQRQSEAQQRSGIVRNSDAVRVASLDARERQAIAPRESNGSGASSGRALHSSPITRMGVDSTQAGQNATRSSGITPRRGTANSAGLESLSRGEPRSAGTGAPNSGGSRPRIVTTGEGGDPVYRGPDSRSRVAAPRDVTTPSKAANPGWTRPPTTSTPHVGTVQPGWPASTGVGSVSRMEDSRVRMAADPATHSGVPRASSSIRSEPMGMERARMPAPSYGVRPSPAPMPQAPPQSFQAPRPAPSMAPAPSFQAPRPVMPANPSPSPSARPSMGAAPMQPMPSAPAGGIGGGGSRPGGRQPN